MQLKSDKEVESIGKHWFILLVYILIILIGFNVSSQIHWPLYVIIFTIIAVFFSLAFWQEYALPELELSNHFLLSRFILLNQSFKSPLVLSVHNGEIDGDYILLKKKPDIRVINVDHRSAVLIESISNQKSLLLQGVHILGKNPKIIGVFYLGLRFIQIGPVDKNALEPKNTHESQTEYHSRISSAEKTRTKLLSGDSIFPSFTVFYRPDTTGDYDRDLDLFLNISLMSKGDNSSLITSNELESSLISEIINNWNAFCNNKKMEEILSAFPGIFEPPDLKNIGLKSQVFLDQIY